MVTSGAQVGKRKLQGLRTGGSLPSRPVVPLLGTISSKLYELEVLCYGNLWVPGWEPGPLGAGSSLSHRNLWFPRWEPSVRTFRNQKFVAMVTYCSEVG